MFRRPVVITSINTLAVLFLSGCDGTEIGDVIDSVYGAFTNQAVATEPQERGLVELQDMSKPKGFTMVGSNGRVTQDQVFKLFHLKFPQSNDAMSSVLGLPHTRTNNADYYVLPNGNPLVVYFDVNTGYAVSYAMGDSGY